MTHKPELLTQLGTLIATRRADLLPAVEFHPGDRLAKARRRLLAEKTAAEGAFTLEIRSHPNFLQLHRSKNFKAAKEIFDQWLDEASELTSPQKAIAELDFLSAIVLWWQMKLDLRPKKVSVKLRRDTIRMALGLLELMNQGADLADRSGNDALRRLLERLTLVQAKSLLTRRGYVDKHWRQRLILKNIAYSLLMVDGLDRKVLVSILEVVAPLFGFDPSLRTVDRYVEWVIAEHGQQIAKSNSRLRATII